MKTHIDQHFQAFVQQHKPEDHHLSPESVTRFLRDPRIWPAEAWFRTTHPNQPNQLRHWHFYPDPTNPEPDDPNQPLVRHWRSRDTELTSNSYASVAECPRSLIEACDLTENVPFTIGIYWQLKTGETLANLPRPESDPPQQGQPDPFPSSPTT